MRAVSVLCCVLVLLVACGGSSDVAETDSGSDREQVPSAVLTSEERAILCESFADDYEALSSAPIHLRGSAFRQAAEDLDQLALEADSSVGELASEMANAANTIEEFARLVAAAEATLDFVPVNYMFTGNGLFVDDGDPATLAGLDISPEDIQALDSVQAVVVEAEARCAGDEAAPAATTDEDPIDVEAAADGQEQSAADEPIGGADEPPLSFEDEFDGALGPGWIWRLEDPSNWSLTAEPGWLQIMATDLGQNILVRTPPSGPYRIETAVRFQPTSNFQFAGLIVGPEGPQLTFLQIGRAFCDPVLVTSCIGDGVYVDHVENGVLLEPTMPQSVGAAAVIYVRLDARDGVYESFYSIDGESWTLLDRRRRDFGPSVLVGIVAHQAFEEPVAAQFEYVRVVSTATVESTATEPAESDFDPDVLIRLSRKDDPDRPIGLEVVRGEVRLTSGATLRTGSSISVQESWMALESGTGIEVGSGGVDLSGSQYVEGTLLVVRSAGRFEVVEAPDAPSEAPDPDLPSYSDILASEWPSELPCETRAGVSGGPDVYQLGNFGGEPSQISIRPGYSTGYCPGARYIVSGPIVTPDGATFPIGTLLTLDADLRFVAVSSWN